MQCCICNKQIGLGEILTLSFRKSIDGYVCRSCRKAFPSVYQIAHFHSSSIKKITEYVQKQADGFECTSRMGKLYLDEMHGKFAISNQGSDFPKELNNVFLMSDVMDFDVSMTDPIMINHKMYCDILLNVHFLNTEMNFHHTLKRKVRCEFKRISSTQLQYRPPREYMIIRTIVSEMLNVHLTDLRRTLDNIKKARQEIENEQKRGSVKYKASGTDIATAKAILMLDDNCTPADIKKHYRQLVRVLHPDILGNDGEAYTQKLNWAYDILTR